MERACAPRSLPVDIHRFTCSQKRTPQNGVRFFWVLLSLPLSYLKPLLTTKCAKVPNCSGI